jgi:hypothetical protein
VDRSLNGRLAATVLEKRLTLSRSRIALRYISFLKRLAHHDFAWIKWQEVELDAKTLAVLVRPSRADGFPNRFVVSEFFNGIDVVCRVVGVFGVRHGVSFRVSEVAGLATSMPVPLPRRSSEAVKSAPAPCRNGG